MTAAKGNETSGSALHRLRSRFAQALTTVLRDVRCLYLVFRNPGTRWQARALLFVPLAYLCSPIQLLPNFIPVLGQMDDLFVIWLSMKLVRSLVDPQVLAECRARAAAMSFSINSSGKSFYTRYSEPATAVDGGAARTVPLATKETDSHAGAARPGP